MATHSITRRTLLSGSLAAGLAAQLPRPATAQGSKPQSLVYTTFGGDYGRWVKGAFEEPFTKATGISITPMQGTSWEIFAKLKAFRDRPNIHVVQFQDRFLQMAAREGLLEPIDYTKVPHAMDVPEVHRRPQWLAYVYLSIGIVYNTKLVQKPLRTWEDLLDDRFKGRIFMDDFNHFGLHALLAISRAYGGGYDNVDPGFKLLRQVKQRLSPRFISLSPEGMKLLSSGEAHVAIWQDARANLLKLQGQPIEYVTPEGGDVLIAYGNGIVKGTGQKEWAENFLGYTVDPANQARFVSRQYPAHPTNPKTVLPPEVQKATARPAGAKQFAVDWDQVLPRLDEWTQRWNREIAG